MKNTFKILLAVINLLSCDNKSDFKEDVCSSRIFNKVQDLIYANEYIVVTEDYYKSSEFDEYLNILDDLKDLKFKIIVASGGLNPDDLNLANGCKKGGEDYFKIYQSSAIFSLIEEISVEEEISDFDEIFNSYLKTSFSEEYLYTEKYFLENSTAKIAIDLSFVELEMYQILFYHYPHCKD